MTQDNLNPDDAAVEPSMELLDGDATAAPTTGPSMAMKIARGSLYGVVLLAATALLAVSAVPELATHLSFIPEASSSSCASQGSCTAIDQVAMTSDSPCCASKSMAAMVAEASGSCCPLSGDADEQTVLASTDATPECCSKKSACCLDETVVADVNAESAPPCCSKEKAAESVLATTDEPIDAGSLLATVDTEEPAKTEPPAEEQAEE